MGMNHINFPDFRWLSLIVAIGTFLLHIIRIIIQWSKNNGPPQLNAEAEVISKRSSSSTHLTSTVASTHTDHYVTFQVGHRRLEFHISAKEYRSLKEGDCGQLSFQGSRFLGFEQYSDNGNVL